MWTDRNRQMVFWKVLAFILLAYFFIPIGEDSQGSSFFTWSGFTDQTPNDESGQTLWMSLYHVYIALMGFALMLIAKGAPELVKSISYLCLGSVGLWGAQWFPSVSARLMSLAVAFSFCAVLAVIHYRSCCRDSFPGWKNLSTDIALLSALVLVLTATSVVLGPTERPVFMMLLILIVGFSPLVFGFMGILEGSSVSFSRMKLSKVLVISWFCVNMLMALSLQHINEFPGRTPLSIQYFRLVFYTLGSLMAITIGLTDLLRIRLLGNKTETPTTGNIQEKTSE